MTTIISDALTIWELVERRAAESGDQRFVFDDKGRSLTYGEFKDQAERVAAGLYAMGVHEGTPVSWQLPSKIDTVVLSMALSRLGAVQNPIIHLYRGRELSFAVRQTGAKVLAIPGEFRGFDFVQLAKDATADLAEPPAIINTSEGLPEGDPSTLPPAPSGAGEAPVRWIYYTSGSTADPKGVQHTDQTLLAGGYGLALALNPSPDNVGSIAFPYAHIGGPDYLIMVLTHGFCAALIEQFVPAETIPFYKEQGVTIAGGGAAFYTILLNEQRKTPGEPIIPTLRMLSGGGGPKPPELHYEVQREMGGRGVCHGYGMTEVPMIVQNGPDGTDEQLANTDGPPIHGIQIRLVTTEGKEAAPGEEGEVRLKGPMVFKGYTDPSLNADAFDEDGWFKTGDLGKMREDGHLSLTGRLKDIIIRKGENVSAREVEDLLYKHPKVSEVAVVGLPDKERGERVCAVVQLAGSDPLTLPELVEFCKAEGLMMQKIPEQLEVVDGFPRLGTGKINKRALQEQFKDKPWP
ncbi:MAG: AMP-dependent synthetase and ligase [Acidimicrobiales bacterium]|nr:AMP-dependent synthetase and ligase [Acidimicrobiales bacterium]